MKLRIKGNTIRFRTVRSEVAGLMESGRVEETVRFAEGDSATLTYALALDAGVTGMEIRHTPCEITILIPVGRAQAWANSDEVGMYGRVDLGAHGGVELSIEKDFACLDQRDDDDEDTFPNPQIGIAC